MRYQNKKHTNHKESGVALFFSLFALLLLSAIAASLVLMTNTETAIDSNFSRQRSADYAAKAGFEEARDRMMHTNANTINQLDQNGNPVYPANLLPTALPGASSGVTQILYILNEGTQTGSVQPWTAGNAYVDDELCHEGYNLPGLQAQSSVASDVRCTQVPSGGSWYATTTSVAPWNGTSAALPYKWVRIGLKMNGSVQGYSVNSGSGQSATTQVCWNGTTEVLLSGATTCQAMTPLSTSPVYVITSLAVTGNSTRKIAQAEVALDPAQPFPFGLFASGTSCNAVTFSGGGNSNPATDSYSSVNGQYGNNNQSDTGGDVGSNGGFVMSGHAQIGGAIGVPNISPSAGCQYNQGNLSTSGNSGEYTGNNGNGNGNGQYAGNVLTQISTETFPTPPDPSPLPPSSNYNGSLTMVPGTYGQVSASGQNTITLSPGTYNLYSLSLSGQASVVVSPPGAVVLNFPSTSSSPINLSGQGVVAANNLPANMQINYGGTGSVTLSGQASSYMNVNAPNASVTVSGNGDIFGRVIAKTLNWSGNGKFHFDRADAMALQSNSFFRVISYRQVSY